MSERNPSEYRPGVGRCSDQEVAGRLGELLMQALGGPEQAANLFLHHADEFSKEERTAHFAPPLRRAVADLLRSHYE